MGIKINKKLQFFSTFDPTKDSKPVSLGDLCKEIENGKITLPIFQTYIRWKVEKSIELLNFQLNGKAAVSPISVNIIEKEELAVQQVSFIDRKLIDKSQIKGKHSVNDGQQRLTCNFKAYIDHEDFKCVVLDISRGEFILNTGEIKKCQIPVGKLYNKEANVFKTYLRDHKDLQEFEVQTLLTDVRSKFMKYYYSVNYAKDLTCEEQMKWFDVLNLAGSRVTGVMVDLTDILAKGVDYYKDYSEVFRETLRQNNLGDLFVRKDTEVSIPLAALNPAYELVINKVEHGINFSPIPSDEKASLISKLEEKQIRKIFELTLTALQETIIFIENNNLSKPERIDYITYMTGAIVLNEKEKFTPNQINCLINWYNTVDFANKSNGQRRDMFSKLITELKYC